MRKLMGIAVVVAAWVAFASSAMAKDSLPIIPGAKGFGMDTVAGSGRHLDPPNTTVYRVTNLNDSGPGSLRDALNAKGPRVVVFEVSGYIELNGGIGIGNPYITVAGQTAPWPGVIVKGGYGLGIGTHDVLIQHLGFRPGGQIKGSYLPHRCGMSTRVGTSHVVIDHCSLGWSTQVGLNLNGHDSTVRLNIFSEGLYKAGHNEGEHSKGMGIGLGHQNDRTRKNIAVTGNLFAHNLGRNPCVTMGTSAVILNNLVYNYAAMGLKEMGDKNPIIMSVIGNVYKAGIDTGGDPIRPWRGKAMWVYLHNPDSRVYISSDNLILGKIYDNPWEHINARYNMNKPDVKPEPRAVVSNPPLEIPGYEVKPARETEKWVLANVGPHPARRGPIDARTVYETRARIGRGRDDVDDAGGWPHLEENHRKLTLPANPNGDNDGDGYTNLEEWLHAFADEVEGRKGSIAGTDPTLGEREAKRCAKKPAVEPKLLERIRNTKADWAFDEAEAKRRQNKAAQDAGLPVTRRIDLGRGVTLELALIPAGEFMMGSKYPPEVTESRAAGGGVSLAKREYPPHRVRITKPCYMGKYELTWDVWDKVMGTPSSKNPRLPALVETDSRVTKLPEFIRKLNETIGKKEKLTFRLPTEAEWEYACRAGTDTPFWFGETITTNLANYNGALWYEEPKEMIYRPRGKKPDRPKTRELLPVGNFAPNPWGLHDTVGNAWELVQGWYGTYPESKQTLVDPQGPTKGVLKGSHIIRGGSFRNPPAECRSAFGMYLAVYRGRETCGLRLVAVPE